MALLEEYARERFGAAAVESMDGDTPAAARHDAVERFNALDAPGFLFLCATRCCGLGTNLPTVAAVVLFDSDWDARSDIQVRADAPPGLTSRGLLHEWRDPVAGPDILLNMAQHSAVGRLPTCRPLLFWSCLSPRLALAWMLRRHEISDFATKDDGFHFVLRV